MAGLDDKWPKFDRFNPGPKDHLHAVAVICVCFNSFERILFDLYIHHLDRKKYNRIISEQYYLSQDEQKRIGLLITVFEHYEKRRKVRDAINNLADYFKWCFNVRNSVLHGENYPTLISSSTDLNLVKRLGRRSTTVGYLSLNLPALRYLADRVEDGRLQAAKINIHLRFRDTPASRRSRMLREYGLEPLPKKLSVPEPLVLSERPHIGPRPQYVPRR